MVKLAYCLRKRPDVTAEEFHDYWLNQHGPLVKKHAEVLKIARYVQLHTLDTPLNAGLGQSRGGPEPFDGIAELWWPDIATLEKVLNAPDAQAAVQELIEDEKKFIDLPRSPVWMARERPVVG